MNVQPGGSLIIAWQVKGKPALVVGAGDVALGRVNNLLDADALVTVVASDLTNPDLKEFIESKPENLTFIQKSVSRDSSGSASISPEELLINPETNEPKYSIVLTAINTPGVSQQIHEVCKKYGIPVNVADVPPLCDFYFASAIRRGPLQVAVSTNGSAPRLARNIRSDIEKSVDSLGKIEQAIEQVGVLRSKLREYTDSHPEFHSSDQEKIRSRMKWVSAVCDGLSYDELASLEPQDMDKLIEKYPRPALSQ